MDAKQIRVSVEKIVRERFIRMDALGIKFYNEKLTNFEKEFREAVGEYSAALELKSSVDTMCDVTLEAFRDIILSE